MSGAEMEKDVITVQIFPEKHIEFGTSSILGTRKNQEDTIYGYAEKEKAIGIVCDGMGGLQGGETASNLAAESLAGAWFEQEEIEDVPEFLKQQAMIADEKVFQLEGENGEPLHAGTTIVAVIIRKRELYWLSVGDSRIYIIRGNEILSVCREHNYRMTLDAMLEEGSITKEEYEKEEPRAEALISYLGMGNLSLMERNQQPFLLEDGDIILLASDGLYRSLPEDEILETVRENQEDMQKAAEQLTARALGEKQAGQDNTSVIVMQYHCEEGKQ